MRIAQEAHVIPAICSSMLLAAVGEPVISGMIAFLLMCCRRIDDEPGGVHLAVDLEVEVEQIPSGCGRFRHE
jgi:hypothetical protein